MRAQGPRRFGSALLARRDPWGAAGFPLLAEWAPWRARDLARPRPRFGRNAGVPVRERPFSNRSDNNFTAGFGFAWTTAAVDTMAEDDWRRALIERDLAFLPTLSDPAYHRYGQLALGMEMYTAQDIRDADPPPGAHPPIPTPASSRSTPQSTP
ncbi:MAG: hypothetical protein Fur0037_01010 [Planctomycetota bacterium]